MASTRGQEANTFCCVSGHSHRLSGFGGIVALCWGAAKGTHRWCRMRNRASNKRLLCSGELPPFPLLETKIQVIYGW